MAILLLCNGDDRAKDLLRNTIMAHYGMSPVGFESVQLVTSGRVRRSLGPIPLWLSLKLNISFQPPVQVRQDYQLSFLGIPVKQEVEAYDGEQYYYKAGKNPASVMPEFLNSIQLRIWAYSAMLLMPLSETYVELEYIDEWCFNAHNTHTGQSATICVYDNYQLKEIIAFSDTSDLTFHLALSSDSQQTEDNIVFAKQLKAGWNEKLDYELYPDRVKFVDQFGDEIFRLN